jgi:hypothetical protein
MDAMRPTIAALRGIFSTGSLHLFQSAIDLYASFDDLDIIGEETVHTIAFDELVRESRIQLDERVRVLKSEIAVDPDHAFFKNLAEQGGSMSEVTDEYLRLYVLLERQTSKRQASSAPSIESDSINPTTVEN